MPQAELSRIRLRNTYVVLLTLGISAVFIVMIWPFVQPLLVAAICAGMLHPVYRKFKSVLRGKEAPASILTIVLLLAIIVGPLATFLGIVVEQAIVVSETAIPWVKEYLANDNNRLIAEKWITDRFPSLEGVMPDRSQLLQGIGQVARNTGGFVVNSATAMTSGTAAFFMHLFVMLYALYFFLIRGRKILDQILAYSPLTADEDERLVGRFVSVARATLKGSVIIGVIQGALGGIGFAFAGIPGATLWGTVMAILSIIPGVGTAVVWIPAVIYLFIQGETTAAIVLLAWCAGVVGTIDNVLRPRLVGQDAQMPDLLILLSTLGGLWLFGGIGFIVGPIICSLFMAVWEIYGETFKDLLPQVARQVGDDPSHSSNSHEQ